jgi:predicted permease
MDARSSPPSTPPSAPPGGGSNLFELLAMALAQCIAIVAIGYFCRRANIISRTDTEGLSGFVARVALPSLILLNMATLDMTALAESASLVGAVLLAKFCLGGIVITATGIMALRDPLEESYEDREPPRGWMRRAGLNAIFATQTNDFALGLPLIEALWPGKFTSTVFVLGFAQLALLNPIAFAVMEAAALAPPGVGGGRGGVCNNRAFEVVRKVTRSPVVAASVLGLILRSILDATGSELPTVVLETLRTVSGTFTGSALTTLGLSLRMRPAEMRGRRVAALLLLLAKFLLAPLLMRLFLTLLESDTDRTSADGQDARGFSLLYGMLPTAPTVVIFAREFGEPSDFLAALQLLGLAVTVPLLLLSTILIESSPHLEPRSLQMLGLWVAGIGTACALALVVAILAGGRRGLRTPLGWLLGASLAALVLCSVKVVESFSPSRSGFSECPSDPGLRALSSWALHCLRGLLAALAVFTGLHACPERRRLYATSPAAASSLLRRQCAAALAVVLVPVIPELLEWIRLTTHSAPGQRGIRAGPEWGQTPAPGTAAPARDAHPAQLVLGSVALATRVQEGPEVCSSVTLRVWHMCIDGVCVLVTLSALALVWLAPTDIPTGTCPIRRGEPALIVNHPGTTTTTTTGTGINSTACASEVDAVATSAPSPANAMVPPPEGATRGCTGSTSTNPVEQTPTTLEAFRTRPDEREPREPFLELASRRLLPATPSHQPLLLRWRTRLCLLQLCASLSMLLSLTNGVTSLHGGLVQDGTQAIFALLDRLCVFFHAIALFLLFGLTKEVSGPITSRVRHCLGACLFGNAEAEIRAFPRSASGFF